MSVIHTKIVETDALELFHHVVRLKTRSKRAAWIKWTQLTRITMMVQRWAGAALKQLRDRRLVAQKQCLDERLSHLIQDQVRHILQKWESESRSALTLRPSFKELAFWLVEDQQLLIWFSVTIPPPLLGRSCSLYYSKRQMYPFAAALIALWNDTIRVQRE